MDTIQKKYTIEKLGQNCRKLFGVSQSTFAGATYGLKGTYTVAEMRELINNWSKKGVKL